MQPYCLLAQVEPSIGAADRCRYDVAWLEIFGAPSLRRNEQFPELPFGQQLQKTPDHRRRHPQRAAAWRSRQKHVARGNVGERGQFRDCLSRLEHEIGRRIVLPQHAVDQEAQIKVVEQREFLRLENRQPWSDRAEAAIALALEELRLWKLHVAGTDVICHRDGEDKVL